MRLVGLGKLLGKPALQSQCRQLRGEFDDQHGKGEPAERVGAINPPGDEQERQPRRQSQYETEEVDPSAPRQCGKVGGRRCGGRRLAQCAAPQFAP